MTKEYLPARQEAGYRYDNQISLIDLWLVLVRYRLVILLSVVVVGALGIAYVVLTPERYVYSSSIQIGAQLAGNEYRLIESPSAVVARIERGFLPLLSRKMAPDRRELGIGVSAVGDGGLITMEGEAASTDEELYIGVLEAVSAEVVAEHETLTQSLRTQLLNEQEQAEVRLEALREESEEIEARIEQLDRLQQDLMSQARGVDGGALLIQLRITEQDEELRQQLLSNAALQREERALLAELSGRLAAFRETREVAPPLRSLEPVNSDVSTIMAVAVLLGLMLGVFLAFFLAFLAQVKEAQRAMR